MPRPLCSFASWPEVTPVSTSFALSWQIAVAVAEKAAQVVAVNISNPGFGYGTTQQIDIRFSPPDSRSTSPTLVSRNTQLSLTQARRRHIS